MASGSEKWSKLRKLGLLKPRGSAAGNRKPKRDTNEDDYTF